MSTAGGDAREFIISSTDKVHDVSCPSISHIIDGLRPIRAYAVADPIDGGTVAYTAQVDARVTVEYLTTERQSRYSRCRICSPDVPEFVSRPRFVTKAMGALSRSDLGRRCDDGVIRSVHHLPDGVLVEFSDHSTLLGAPEDTLTFRVKGT